MKNSPLDQFYHLTEGWLPQRIKRRGMIFPFVVICSLVFHLGMAQQVSEVQERNYTLLGLGDSITEGGNNFSSYLYPLWEKLYLAGYQVEFIGPNQSQTTIGGIAHAGYSGRNAEFLASQTDRIYRQFPADIVLLHTGHNHFSQENPVTGIIAAHQAIVAKIKSINPEAIILIAKVIESGKLPKYSYIPVLNEEIEQFVAETRQTFGGVYLVDQANAFEWKEDTIDDKVHPNEGGALKMATVWFDKLTKVMDKPSLRFNPELVTYKNTPTEELKLHIFKPDGQDGEAKRSCILFFFGGGWKVGSPLQFYREASYFASKGMVAISADYSTEFDNGTSAFESVGDAKSAIRWIRKNAEKYNIDPDRIAVAGASAGGHLAAATGTLSGFDDPDDELSISARANLNLLFYPVIDNGPNGYGSDKMKAGYKAISPLHNVTVNTPPTLILVGTEDPLLPVATAEKYRSLLVSKGVQCELKLYPGAGHPIFYYRKGYSPFYVEMIQDSENFLRQYGYLKKQLK
ncbi:alpha/beta hydrolase fold domain-containing protein [Algoriphagus resistens]|uniref:alpha/beta hydrolase fold domain-containing protein n=1 Tax=Algoriphagus resistens TaxID=1750590 RepID=UPI000AC28248|nr:alpha/beta hydrolase fold domain-containing protein [Algoriphagus resistens]